MGTFFRHPGVAGNIPDDHGTIVEKTQSVAVHTQVAPVGVQDVPGPLRHFEGFQHLVDRIAARPDKVREVGLHVGGIRLPVDRAGIGLGRPDLLAEVEKVGHGLPGAGDILLHLVDKGLYPKGHHAVIFSVGGNHVVGLGDADPIDFVLDAQFPEQGTDVPWFLWGAEVVELVEAGLKFEPPPLEAGGKAAGQVVLLQHQAGASPLQNPDGGGEPAVTGTDHHHVIGVLFLHKSPPFSMVLADPYKCSNLLYPSLVEKAILSLI